MTILYTISCIACFITGFCVPLKLMGLIDWSWPTVLGPALVAITSSLFLEYVY